MNGLERTYEKVLMGVRGIKRFIRDNKSRIQGPYENRMFDTAAVAGRNLYTSVDVEVQQLARKIVGQQNRKCRGHQSENRWDYCDGIQSQL